ncbi:putative sodium:solute symporter [Prochlorococcus marinus str. MIT 9321]|uniref:Putative sodium:solute symporter n=1 Tax=Prochlorococcus marinus str. MIT 9401 TaxID=167551 RepID=A0A0A2B2H1_PROMR|nr:sodium:solute symporter [Prochlorococcus marinus]KGG03522.1 putative sodium:solute symporter [Prochlorococcus marinus str. MIT 9321]KGG04663.1 putative sodium:solute symporter [Prochlorococcus marinus str. MIT 9322]KGG07347.1 putative sodium:solute symporter [Prochlorococcus marinus str. MIT 9401]
MNIFSLQNKDIFSNSLLISFFGLLIIFFLLIFGRKFKLAVQLERFGLPIAVISGIIGIFIGPFGAIHFLPKETINVWSNFPTPLLSLVFATLMMGRPIPNINGLVKPIFNQFLLALALGFGQFFVGGLVVKYFLPPSMDTNPLMGCLIEVGFEGGHGAASIIGESFNKLGFQNGLDLGLAMATMGLLSSSILGSIFIFLGRTVGLSDKEEILEQKENVKDKKIEILADLRIFIINLGLSGLAISFGVLLLKYLRYVSSSFGDFSKEIIFSLPVFPFILIGSLLIRYILEKTKNTEFISNILQREIGILSTDLLIFTAMASLDIAVVFDNWVLILEFTIFGLFWNLICIAYFAYFIFDDYWFEKSLIEFGNSTGVVASGLLLLRLADPKNISKTLPIFTSKQLFAQLILSGGLFTVLAPLMISKIGLDYWTEICALITFAILFIALIFNKVEMKKFQ